MQILVTFIGIFFNNTWDKNEKNNLYYTLAYIIHILTPYLILLLLPSTFFLN